MLQHVRQRGDTRGCQIDDVRIIDEPNPHNGIASEEAADFHGCQARDCTSTGSRNGLATFTGFLSARPKPPN
jgi:hypothetical protein